MNRTLLPSLCVPDPEYWRRFYPDGIGPSIFSSPGWQYLMQQELGPPWQTFFLRCCTPGGSTLSLPVLAKKSLWGRLEIITRPVAYYVTPMEGISSGCEEAVRSLIRAAGTPFTAALTWWLPPWCVWRPAEANGGGCKACNRSGLSPWCSLRANPDRCRPESRFLTSSLDDTYLITLDEPSDEFLVRRVQKRQRQHAETSLQMGVEVVSGPSQDQVDEYYQLYMRVYGQRAWEGPPYSLGLFLGVCRTLGRGGELVLMRYQGRTIGGGVLLYDRYAVHIFQATTDREVKGVYPHPLLYRIAIERAASRGLHFVNLGGVNEGNEGLKRFKREWGARPTPVSLVRWQCSGRDLLKTVLMPFGGFRGSVSRTAQRGNIA
jgi:hypothetical protein